MTDTMRDDINSALIQVDATTRASPKEARRLLAQKRKDRAARRHNADHPDQFITNPLLYGKHAGKKKYESDSVKAEHIDEMTESSKRSKKYENQR